MKAIVTWLMVGLVAVLVGCSNSTEPDPRAIRYAEVDYHGVTHVFDEVVCSVSGSVGGPVVYSLHIRMTDEESRSVEFSVQDEENNPENLISIGEHHATGHHGDGVGSYMQPAGFFVSGLTSRQLSVVWEEVEMTGRVFSGRGYVHLKERIEPACADSIWVGGYFAKPGDPEYERYYESYCEPGYFFPEQKVWFKCVDGSYGGKSGGNS